MQLQWNVEQYVSILLEIYEAKRSCEFAIPWLGEEGYYRDSRLIRIELLGNPALLRIQEEQLQKGLDMSRAAAPRYLRCVILRRRVVQADTPAQDW